MWIARDEDGTLNFFSKVPNRLGVSWCVGDNVSGYKSKLDSDLFPELTWDDEPMEVGLFPISNDVEEPQTSIILTTYYEDYDGHRDWFFNMLKHQDRYKDCTDEECEQIWQDHIHEDYEFDEIWTTTQCDGYTDIALTMNRYEYQPHHVKVCESKEYIDNILKKYGY